MQDFTGRVAVVTGAAGGIGYAIAERFTIEGMKVVLADIDAEYLTQAVATLRDAGADVEGVVTDVSDAASVEALAEAVVARYGALHVAVNNAGIVNRGLTWELSLEEWQRVLGINLWGVIHGIKSFVPRILATGEEGHVVNVASMAAVNVIPRLAPYTASKHAVLGISDVLRLDFAEVGAPVGVSVVMPGGTNSRMNPIAKLPASGVADNVVDAMRRGRFFVFTDQESRDAVEQRMAAIVAARNDVVPS
jgi:NAD(P)-dependent dehydrogenase (short-subunit alcohol dehydrogenase family)